MSTLKEMMGQALAQEEARLERIMSMPRIGICYQGEQMEIREYEDDPALREALIEYQRERIRQLALTELSLAHQAQPGAYPVLDE